MGAIKAKIVSFATIHPRLSNAALIVVLYPSSLLPISRAKNVAMIGPIANITELATVVTVMLVLLIKILL